jgi:RNA polymerase sigma-70 factor (ECF subfamily)
LLGDQDDAEDIVQVAFILVHERAGGFDATRPFRPWLYAVVRRLASNRRARDARRARLLELWGRWSGGVAQPRADRADSAIDAEEDVESVRQIMTTLSPMQRACFELVALRGIPAEEVAAMHGISESTVRQHVFRARRALSHALQGGGTDDETGRSAGPDDRSRHRQGEAP